VKQREIRNLLRFVKGFESAVVNTRGPHALAFATFVDQESALEAIKLLTNLKFDEENAPQTELRLELAKSNSSGKKRGRDVGPAGPSFSTPEPDKKLRTDPMPTFGGSAKTPCNTLFLANLGRYTTEQEIRNLFGMLPGFRKLKFNSVANKTPVCFVDFIDHTTSQAAMTTYQGHLLASSEGGSGMRIEYAKKPMLPSEGVASVPVPAVSSYPTYADPYGVAGYSLDPSTLAAMYQQYAPPGTYSYPTQ